MLLTTDGEIVRGSDCRFLLGHLLARFLASRSAVSIGELRVLAVQPI